MNILFIHQNFPGQFIHLAPALVSRGHSVTCLVPSNNKNKLISGVNYKTYTLTRGSTKGIHRWVVEIESQAIRAEACFEAALELRSAGFYPDRIISHNGWGESLFLKDVWPTSKQGLYGEFFYHSDGYDVGFDNEVYMRKENSACKITFKNVNNMLSLEAADDMICPTRWQAESFPSEYRSRITIVHDGIDTDKLAPNSKSTITLRSGLTLTRDSEIVTFLSRNLEPYRGYHILMRALPRLLEQRPNLRVIIVGGDGVSYGSEPETKNGVKQSWKNLVIDEVKESIKPEDWSRIHFVGKVPYDTYTRLIQISSVHIYLTYPFVLSWSLLEAMSMGAAIVASGTKPVLEYIKDGENGLLFDFFDVDALTDLTIKLLQDPSERSRLGMNARKSVVSKLDLKTICLPHQIDWVENI